MPSPVIQNPYNSDNFLTAYLGEPLSVKLAISNSPSIVGGIGDWIGWKYRWLETEGKIELLITPTRLLRDEIEPGLIAWNTEIRLDIPDFCAPHFLLIPKITSKENISVNFR